MSEQRIFGPYNDGMADVFADPFKVFLALVRLLDGDPEAVNKQAREPFPLDSFDGEGKAIPPSAQDVAAWRLSTSEAQQQLADAAREAFEMQPFDKLTGCGATDEMCQKVLDDFLAYMDGLKKNIASTPTSPPPTVPPPPSVPGLSPAKNDSDCGCS